MPITPAELKTRAALNKKRRLEAGIIVSLASGNTVVATCEITGATRPQVFAILNDPEKRERIREERARIGTEITAALVAHARKAADYLLTILEDATAPDSSRVRAAGLLLSEARAWRTDDIEDRLTALEHQANRSLQVTATR